MSDFIEPYCSRRPVATQAELDRLLGDSNGVQYYADMQHLGVDRDTALITLRTTLASRIQAWLFTCAHCGNCADACHFWHADNEDPAQIPAAKIQSTLSEFIRKTGLVDSNFMLRAMDAAWGQCTQCGHCAEHCPFGIDTGAMMGYLRGLLFEQGYVPWELKSSEARHRVCAAQNAVPQAGDAPAKGISTDIPLDIPEVDILYVGGAGHGQDGPHSDLAQAAALFQLAGESWTASSAIWDRGFISFTAGNWAGTVENLERFYGVVSQLRPRRVVGFEGGQSYRAAVMEGPYLMGREDGSAPVPMFHFAEWLLEALRSGKLRIDPARKIKEACTVRDCACSARNGGLGAILREIMAYIAEDFREMPANGAYAGCCNGPGGIGRYQENCARVLDFKAEQIRASGATLVITSCPDCQNALRGAGIRCEGLKALMLDMAKR